MCKKDIQIWRPKPIPSCQSKGSAQVLPRPRVFAHVEWRCKRPVLYICWTWAACGHHLVPGLDGKRVTTTMVELLHFTSKQSVFCGWVPVVLSWRQMMKLNTGLFKVTCSNNDHTPLSGEVCEIPSADRAKLNKGEDEGFDSANRQ